MSIDLFAGLPVSDYQRSLGWYERLLGAAPAFFPNEIEAVWEVTGHGYLYIRVAPEHAGHALHTLFVPDLDQRVAGISARGIEPDTRERYDNGVTKITYRDPDGNELGFGGGPAAAG